MNENLSPHQFDPYVESAVQELAHGHAEWTGEHQPLDVSSESVRPGSVRFQRYPTTDSRVQSAIRGYSGEGEVPPVTLVRRAGETMTADGHHRLSAAEHLGIQVPAAVAISPRTDAYQGRANIGTLRKPRNSG